eukprot:6186547-Pleurochrysis_carterae.AAC.1
MRKGGGRRQHSPQGNTGGLKKGAKLEMSSPGLNMESVVEPGLVFVMGLGRGSVTKLGVDFECACKNTGS